MIPVEMVEIVFSDHEQAVRVGKAFSHIAQLCGTKVDPFQ
jgi:hypothetical protein